MGFLRGFLGFVDVRFRRQVIFPELVRYSAIRDKMEITLLKTLYRNLGEDYADFSVGVALSPLG